MATCAVVDRMENVNYQDNTKPQQEADDYNTDNINDDMMTKKF